MTRAARAMAERKTFGHRSYRVATRLQILESSEHDLDAIAPLISSLVEFDRRLALLSAWDAGAYPLSLQRFSEPASIIAAIPE